MIYTVTLNPSIDYHMHVESLVQNATNRSTGESLVFGGKGINCSIMLSNLGAETTALGICAGFTGKALCDGLTQMKIKHDFVYQPQGYTRINIKLAGRNETEINANGPLPTKESIDSLFERLDKIKSGDICVLSGGIPDGCDKRIYSDIATLVGKKGARIAVDASGELLTNTLVHAPFVIKPNLSELAELCGAAESIDEVAENAKKLIRLGAENVLVSMGGNGSLLVDKNGCTHRLAAYSITPIDTVGAGDSMLAGFLYSAWLMGNEPCAAHAFASACGAATASTMGIADKNKVQAVTGLALKKQNELLI